MPRFQFPVRYARRVPDPNFYDDRNVERHILFVPAKAVPAGLPLDPNARVPQIHRRVYRDIEQSLMNVDCEPGTFHLKHKGITVVADSVRKVQETIYTVTLREGQGILDGGHTYELLTKEREEEIPDNQFVKFEILTNVPDEWIVELSAGLNTSVQVQPMSLHELAGKFDWIKDIITNEPYFQEIAWREGENGEFDARDIVSILTCFNIGLFPNTNDEQPVVAYEKKSDALKLHLNNDSTYRNLSPIVKDILFLHDTIRRDSREYWNEAGGKFGSFAFVESKKKKGSEYAFPFTGATGKYRLINGALYPMLAAFRWMVDEKKGKYRWRGGFKSVLRRWEDSAKELMRMTAVANQELGRNPNAIGKSRNHWSNLHARVAMRDLMQRTARVTK